MRREVRQRTKKADERDRGGKRGGSYAVTPYPTPGLFFVLISLRRLNDLRGWNSQGIAAVTCDQAFFFLTMKG